MCPAEEDKAILCLVAENSVNDGSRDDGESNWDKVFRIGNCRTNSIQPNGILLRDGIQKERIKRDYEPQI
jgi:hypothetical protein